MRFRLSFMSLVCLALSLSSCQSKPIKSKATESVGAVQTVQLGKARQLTFSGDNQSARFSPNGDKFIFASQKRLHHMQSQIYEFDLKTNSEKRVTYHDGDATSPAYINPTTITYASSTDEIKEAPLFLQNNKSAYDEHPSEIYISGVHGDEIVRMTTNPGYDGQPEPVKGKPQILFSSKRGGNIDLYLINTNTKAMARMTNSPQDDVKPRISWNAKMYTWIRVDKDNNTQIWVSDFKKSWPLTLPGGQYSSVTWMPEDKSLIVSAKLETQKDFDLYLVNLESSCTQLLLQNPGDDSEASASPDGSKLLLTNNISSKNQIYIVDMPSDLGACL